MYRKGFHGSKEKLSFFYRFPSNLNINGCKSLLDRLHKNFSLIYHTQEYHDLKEDEISRIEYSIRGALRLKEERIINFDFKKNFLPEDFSYVEFFATEDPELRFYQKNVEIFDMVGKTIDNFFVNLGIELSDK